LKGFQSFKWEFFFPLSSSPDVAFYFFFPDEQSTQFQYSVAYKLSGANPPPPARPGATAAHKLFLNRLAYAPSKFSKIHHAPSSFAYFSY
jgi:hypothetical protein